MKIDNKGNLLRKGEILCTLAKKLEPYEKPLLSTEFSRLCTDTTLLLNKIGPRHALTENNQIEKKAQMMSPEEQELWYDRAFQMFLACMAVVPYVGYKSEIKGLKSADDRKDKACKELEAY